MYILGFLLNAQVKNLVIRHSPRATDFKVLEK